MVDAPNLEYLGVSQCCLVQYCLKSYPSLVKADITLLPNSMQALGRILCGNGVDGLLKAVSNVECLFLNAFDVEALDLAMDNNWPVFPNFLNLEMWFPHGFGGKSFSDLLNGVPNLHTLHIFNHTYGPLVFNWFEPTEKPRFLQSCLQEVEFQGIQGMCGELMMI